MNLSRLYSSASVERTHDFQRPKLRVDSLFSLQPVYTSSSLFVCKTMRLTPSSNEVKLYVSHLYVEDAFLLQYRDNCSDGVHIMNKNIFT